MSNAAAFYSGALHKHFSLLGTWMPNSKISLGDVGVWEKGIFKRLTSLETLGIALRTRKGSAAAAFSFSSEMTITIENSLSAAPARGLPAASAEVKLAFTNQGGFLFQAVDCYQDEIQDRAALAKAILGYVRTGEWKADWAVVDSVIRAGSATIVISNSSKGSLNLHADGPVEFSSLAKLNTGFKITSESGDIARFISQSGIVPLFTLGRLKTSIMQRVLGFPSESMRFGGSGDTHSLQALDDPFEPVAPAEAD